jgi:hypothetical protein
MEGNDIYQSAEPCIELMQTGDGPVWEVSGFGYVTQHKQLWQAMLRFDCICLSKGLDPSRGYR